MKTKKMLVTTLKEGKPTGHPQYIEKSVFQQLWEQVLPGLTFLFGIFIGWSLF